MITKKPKDIDEYIRRFPKETQEILKLIRTTISKASPKAEETISYAIPAFKLNGRELIYFAGYKKHVSVYPAPRGDEAFKKELTSYKGGKGTVQFPLEDPIPLDLVTRIVKHRMKQILATEK